MPCKATEYWLQTYQLEELDSLSKLPQVGANFPVNTVGVHPAAFKGVKSNVVGSMQLNGRSQWVLNATFSGVYTYTDSTIKVWFVSE